MDNWTPEEASLLQDLLQRQSTSQGNMGDSEPPDILYVTCACIIHTTIVIMIETLHDQSFALIASETPNHQFLGTRGPRDRRHDVSEYETLVLVSFTLIYSATCA